MPRSRFASVENETLRRRLEKTKATVTAEDVQIILVQTLQALGEDATRDDIPASAFEARRVAAREALAALRGDRKVAAFRNLQKFWIS